MAEAMRKTRREQVSAWHPCWESLSPAERFSQDRV